MLSYLVLPIDTGGLDREIAANCEGVAIPFDCLGTTHSFSHSLAANFDRIAPIPGTFRDLI